MRVKCACGRQDACRRIRASMPKLRFFVTEDLFFVSHFLPTARAARQAGFDVTVAMRVRKAGARLEAEGLRVISLEAERGESRRAQRYTRSGARHQNPARRTTGRRSVHRAPAGRHWWYRRQARNRGRSHPRAVPVLLSRRAPCTLVEAAAAGRPIVTTNVSGCRGIESDGVEGIPVPPGDIDAAGRALARLAGDPALRARMGAAANRRF
jgi:Glycosyl transferases group 1